MATYTPWGPAQYSEQHFRGCTTFFTASHGGIHISSSVMKYLSEYTIKKGLKYDKGLWYEEDIDYLLPVYELSKVPEFKTKLEERYKIPTIDQIKECFPDYEDNSCE